MPSLTFRTSKTCHEVGAETIHGAYLLQSDLDPTQFRIGIAGQRDRGTFAKRLRLHMRAKATHHNWTTRNRPWTPLWTLEIVGGTALSACIVEHLLYTVLGHRYAFINDSGFAAPASEAEHIRDLVLAQTGAIIDLVSTQLGQRVTIKEPTSSPPR